MERVINIYRPTFSSVFHTPINNYLCDTEGSYLQLKNQIYLNHKLVLQSPTGTGKTYLMLCRFANDPAFFKQLGIERIVYLYRGKIQQIPHAHIIVSINLLVAFPKLDKKGQNTEGYKKRGKDLELDRFGPPLQRC